MRNFTVFVYQAKTFLCQLRIVFLCYGISKIMNLSSIAHSLEILLLNTINNTYYIFEP